MQYSASSSGIEVTELLSAGVRRYPQLTSLRPLGRGAEAKIVHYLYLVYIGTVRRLKGVHMAKTTSISLGDHFTGFIEAQVESGRFGSASEVVRAGLRSLEERELKHQALQRAITEGLSSGVAEEFSMDALQQEMDDE